MDTALLTALEQVAPFRFGLVSILMFTAPGLLLAIITLTRTRQALAVCTVLAAGLFALAVPVRLMQQAVAGWEWQVTQGAPDGVPSRAWLQVVTLPGMPQAMPYDWNPLIYDGQPSRLLVAYFNQPVQTEAWAAIESVTSDRSTPPPALIWAATDPGPASCTQLASDLWRCVPVDSSQDVAFVRRTDGVMLTLAGWTGDDNILRRAILAAHPATDADLVGTATGLAPRSPLGFLLL